MTADRARLRAIVPALAGHRIVVVGDLILDEYLVGRPSRISREAPVLVLEFSRRFCRPGGAGNPAVNIQALGSTAHLVARTGDDERAATLLEELARAGLSAGGIVRTNGQGTAVKTRLLAEDSASRQHVARLDYLAPPPTQATRAELAARLERAARTADALLLSDYKAGVIDAELIALVRDLGRRHDILTSVDSQGDLAQFGGLDLVKCNQSEAEAATGRSLESDAQVESVGQELLASLASRYVVLTRGAAGLSVFERDGDTFHLPAANQTEVFDVTGAGDTVVALMTLALVAGANLVEAATLANLAAGLVVRRLGVATTTPDELLAASG